MCICFSQWTPHSVESIRIVTFIYETVIYLYNNYKSACYHIVIDFPGFFRIYVYIILTHLNKMDRANTKLLYVL